MTQKIAFYSFYILQIAACYSADWVELIKVEQTNAQRSTFALVLEFVFAILAYLLIPNVNVLWPVWDMYIISVNISVRMKVMLVRPGKIQPLNGFFR